MLIEVMVPYERIPEHLVPADFRLCSGMSVNTFYTPLFAELVWRALRSVVVMPARTRADPVLEGCLPAGKPDLPLRCTMVTRTVSLNSKESQEPRAKDAVAKEVASHAERGTWDFSRVRELSEWMRDDAYTATADIWTMLQRLTSSTTRPIIDPNLQSGPMITEE